MKVVIFCGGLGVRMGEETQRIPKPMITGRQPADPLAHHEVVRVLGARRLRPLPRLQGRDRSRSTSSTTTRRSRTTSSSRTAAATSSCSARDISELAHHVRRHRHAGRRSASGCSRSRPHLGDDEYFLATYGDGLTDAPLADMIDRLALERARPALFLSVRPMLQRARRRRGRRRRRHARSRTCRRRTSGSTAASSSSAATSSTTSSPGEELVDEPFAAADRARASCSPTATRASGSRWTRSRTSSGSTRSRRAASAPWRSSRRSRPGAGATECSSLALAGARRAARGASSRSAATPTTSRSAAARRSSR